MLGNLFCIDLRRAICSRAFLLTVLAMIFVELLSAGPILSIPEFGVTEILDNLFAGTDSASLLFMLFPLFPGALTYAKDVQERSVNFWLIRAKVKAYMASKYLAACVSALLALETSFAVLTFILLAMGHGLCNPLAYEVGERLTGYLQMLQDGNVAGYLVLYTLDRGMSAAMMAGCAVFLSAIYPNPYFAACGPTCIYYLVLRAFPSMGSEVLLPTTWMGGGVYHSPDGGVASFFCKMGVTLLVCGVYCALSVWIMGRRWRHG